MGFLSAIGTIAGTYFGGPVGGAIGNTLGSLGDSAISGSGSSSAASTQAGGATSAVALQKQIYDQNRSDQLPTMQRGNAAGAQLAYLMGLNPGAFDSSSNAPGTPAAGTNPYSTNPNPLDKPQAGKNYDWERYQADEAKWRAGTPGGKGNGPYEPTLANYIKEAPEGSHGYANVNSDIGAYGSLSKPFGMEDFTADPGYAFRMSEGTKALERSAAAKGGLNSGATLKAITRFGQDTASQEYGTAYNRYNNNQNNLYNRLAGIAGTGQSATNQIGAEGTNYANNAATGIQNAANYNASGQVANTNAWTTGLSGIGSAFTNYNNTNNAISQSIFDNPSYF